MNLERLGLRSWRSLPYVVSFIWVVALVMGHSAGRIGIGRALVLLALPIVAFGTVLRPAWVVLFFAAAPLGNIPIAPTRALVLLLLIALAGQLVVRGTISLGWRSGFVPLIVLVGVAFFFRADVVGQDALTARGWLTYFAYFVLLGLIAYNETRSGHLQGKHLLDALLFGLMLAVILEHTVLPSGLLGSGTQPVGRAVALLAAAGFALSFARLLLPKEEEAPPPRRALYFALMMGFGIAMVPGLMRTAWLSALVATFFILRRAQKPSYWLIIPAALVLLMAVPVTRERVVPSTDRDVTTVTTGRWELWTDLWEHVDQGLPWGNGFGYMFGLDAEDVVGSDFGEGIPLSAHNDFLYWMVDLGLLGFLGIVVFWHQLVRAFRSVSHSMTANRYYVEILAGLLITAFIAQLFASTFFTPDLAGRFFIAAGFVFGARTLTEVVPSNRSSSSERPARRTPR